MTPATEYRRLLDECLHWAANARTDSERTSFLQMAKTWHEAAVQLEKSLGLVKESRDLVERSKQQTKEC